NADADRSHWMIGVPQIMCAHHRDDGLDHVVGSLGGLCWCALSVGDAPIRIDQGGLCLGRPEIDPDGVTGLGRCRHCPVLRNCLAPPKITYRASAVRRPGETLYDSGHFRLCGSDLLT